MSSSNSDRPRGAPTSNDSRRRTPRTQEQGQPPSFMPPAGVDPTRGLLARQEPNNTDSRQCQSQRSDERAPSPRPTRTDTAPVSIPSPPPPTQRTGHRFGIISMTGNAKALVGNAFDPDTIQSPDDLPMHEYGRIQGAENAKFMIGDTSLEGAGMFLEWDMAALAALPRGDTR